jgi:hypothetical protein
VLEKVCEYFYYNEKFKDAKDVPDMDFPLELSLELLMAADYLNGMFPKSYREVARSHTANSPQSEILTLSTIES